MRASIPIVLGCLCGLLFAGCGGPPQMPAPPMPLVTVSQPIPRDVTDYEDFIGRTAAVSSVDIRARVSGYLVKVGFKDGDVVKENTLLYEIDQRPFQADLDQARGQLERLQAEKKLLVIQVDRYRKLAEKGAGSQQDLDQYLAQQAENVGALKAAEAQVRRAELNLGFTRIEAPITGQVSRTYWTVGNLVNADSTLLTTLVSIDPMYAYFDIEEPTMLRIRRMIREGVIPSRSKRHVEVQIGLADDVDRKFPLRGFVDFVDNTVDPQTGTIQVRAVVQNPNNWPDVPPLLAPGLFVRVRLLQGVPHRTLLVTERAIGTNQGKKYVYVIGPENKVVYRPVKLGQSFDGLRSVEEGLEAGQRVVVNGLQRIRPGVQVRAEQVEMSSLAGAADAADEIKKPSPPPADKPTPVGGTKK